VEVNGGKWLDFNPAPPGSFEVFCRRHEQSVGKLILMQAGNAFCQRLCNRSPVSHMAPGGHLCAGRGGAPSKSLCLRTAPFHRRSSASHGGLLRRMHLPRAISSPRNIAVMCFMGNIHQNAINHDLLTPNGSSFKSHGRKKDFSDDERWLVFAR